MVLPLPEELWVADSCWRDSHSLWARPLVPCPCIRQLQSLGPLGCLVHALDRQLQSDSGTPRVSCSCNVHSSRAILGLPQLNWAGHETTKSKRLEKGTCWGEESIRQGWEKGKKVGRMSDQNAFYTRLSKKNFFKKERKASD